MKEKLIMFGLLAAFSGAVFLAGYFKGQGSCQVKQSNQVIKEVTKDAQSYANRPRSVDDIVDELCKRGIAAAKSDSTADRQLLSECRERVQRGK